MNEIRVSFDQQRAVRIEDGLELTAAPPTGSVNRCDGCAVPDTDNFENSCFRGDADNPLIRCCNAEGRKDARDIIWRPA